MSLPSEVSAMLDQILAASPWPVLLLAHDGAVLAASEEPAALPGDVPLRERAGHYAALVSGGDAREIASARRRADGSLAHESIHPRRMPWGLCLTIVDQTELKRLQAAEAQTARLAALGFMVAGVCHEVTNPLTSLHSIVQILRAEKDPSPALLSKGLDNIAGNVKRILDISRRLVTFSRVGEEPHARFAIDDAIEEALGVLRVDHLLRDIVVRHDRDASAVMAGRMGQVREVFLNLLVNAIQAMGGHGRLSIETRADAASLSVSVADSGPGVSAEAAPRIFEPFFTTKGGAHGTGLGLAISMEIVHEHGGAIELAQSSQYGAVFKVTFPRETA
ncbi:MAG: two-component sensor histidine kinase [Proteobacteria bacterium]|nr:two-component sensor histidine kinase [Pseudomonadota bacterium]